MRLTYKLASAITASILLFGCSDNSGSAMSSENYTNITISNTEQETYITTEKVEEQSTTTVVQRGEPVTEPAPDIDLVPAYESKIVECTYIPQIEYPTGCEIVSLAMLLGNKKLDISLDDIYANLDMENPYDKNGKLYGPDPNTKFIGDPKTDTGFGCYNGAIDKLTQKLLKLKKIEGYNTIKTNGEPLDILCAKYIDNNTPVLVWASIYMNETYLDEQYQWIIEETNTGFKWVCNEHCLVLIGYDNDYYYFNDPWVGASIQYDKALAEQRYEELGMQAFTIKD